MGGGVAPDDPFFVGLQDALGYAPLGRFAHGFSVFHDGPIPDEAALRSLGIMIEDVAPPLPLVADPVEAVATAWTRILAVVEAVAPEALAVLASPARAEDVAHVERELGTSLPGDYLAWLALHDGQVDDYGPFEWMLAGVVGSIELKAFADEHLADRSDRPDVIADPGVRRRWWHRGWFPFASNGAGDRLCLDLDPAPGGCVGQVIEYFHNDERRACIASSFGTWLRGIAEQLEQRGRVTGH